MCREFPALSAFSLVITFAVHAAMFFGHVILIFVENAFVFSSD
jgi:hypothetical protein